MQNPAGGLGALWICLKNIFQPAKVFLFHFPTDTNAFPTGKKPVLARTLTTMLRFMTFLVAVSVDGVECLWQWNTWHPGIRKECDKVQKDKLPCEQDCSVTCWYSFLLFSIHRCMNVFWSQDRTQSRRTLLHGTQQANTFLLARSSAHFAMENRWYNYMFSLLLLLEPSTSLGGRVKYPGQN